MQLSKTVIALAAFAAAALLSYLGAAWAVTVIEARSEEAVHRRLLVAGIEWATARADGLQLHLSGMAPTEAARFRAISAAAGEIDPARIRDEMGVVPAADIAPPRFSVELLRNGDGISLIGLVPAATGHDPILAKVNPLAGAGRVTDMLEVANDPAPAGWTAALAFGLDAAALLPRSKISIAADHVAVTAISDSAAEQHRLESELARKAPEGLEVSIRISAPRPVITPFTLRFVIDEAGARFDACSADTEEARNAILAAASAAGVTGKASCTIGLGVPSPAWADAAVTAIGAVKAVGMGSVTFSDADVTFLADADTTQATYDRVVGDLGAKLPDVFSLKATRAEKPKAATAAAATPDPVEFTATLSPAGEVQLRGRLADERQRNAATNYAKARFGAEKVYSAARLDPGLPEGWPLRVLAAIEALAELHHGLVSVKPDTVEVSGVAASSDASDRVSRILSDKLGQGKAFSIKVSYDKTLDPVANLPAPQECADRVNAVLAKKQITFDPGSDRPDAASLRVIDDIAQVLKKGCIDVTMEVGGYTDNQGREEMNLTLSQHRAQAVLTALMARRVPVSNLIAKGYGEANPIADNDTDAGREANRRIEFRLITAAEKDAEAKAATDAATNADADAEPEVVAPDNLPEGEGGDSPIDSAGAMDEGGDTPADDTGAADDSVAADAPAADGAAVAATGGGTGEAPYASSAPSTMTIRPKARP